MIRQFARQFTTGSRVLRAEAAAAGKKGVLNLRFSTPTESLFANVEVARVTIPATTGDMGVVADHVPTIAQLRPGVVEVIEDDKATEGQKWFVPGGFAIISADSTASVTAVEAIPVADIDVAKAESELAKARLAMDSAKDEMEKAEMAIGVEVLEAMSRIKV